MKKANSIVIATIIAAFGITMFAFQPTTEASCNVSPSATPSPRRKLPRPVQSPITKIKAKKPSNWSFGQNDSGSQARKQPRKRSTSKRQHLPCEIRKQDCK